MFAAPPLLNLVVIRSRDLERSEKFFSVLGIGFERHRHGKGVEHLAGGAIELAPLMEIYPLADGQTPTSSTRIGFNIDAVDAYIDGLLDAGGKLIAKPHDSEWGRRAVVQDPDGHKVELVCPVDREKHLSGDNDA